MTGHQAHTVLYNPEPDADKGGKFVDSPRKIKYGSPKQGTAPRPYATESTADASLSDKERGGSHRHVFSGRAAGYESSKEFAPAGKQTFDAQKQKASKPYATEVDMPKPSTAPATEVRAAGMRTSDRDREKVHIGKSEYGHPSQSTLQLG